MFLSFVGIIRTNRNSVIYTDYLFYLFLNFIKKCTTSHFPGIRKIYPVNSFQNQQSVQRNQVYTVSLTYFSITITIMAANIFVIIIPYHDFCKMICMPYFIQSRQQTYEVDRYYNFQSYSEGD